MSNLLVALVLLVDALQVIRISSQPNAQVFDEFCPLKYKPFDEHAACAKPSTYLVAGGISTDDIQAIINITNTYRRNVNPPATNMLLMTWDDELSFIAQRWANSCVLNTIKHWDQNTVPDRFAYVGQNIAWGYTRWLDAIDAMTSNHDQFVYGKPFSSTYLQITWATTSKVGCGYSECNFAGSSNTFFVCNYAPGGNIYWSDDPMSPYKPYTNGSTCANCPLSCNDNLCDCGDLTCDNGGTLDVNTCSCNCYRTFDVGSTCQRNCSAAIDNVLCQGQTGVTAYSKAMCSQYINVPYLCPQLCEYCPDGTKPFSMPPMKEFDMKPKPSTTTSTASIPRFISTQGNQQQREMTTQFIDDRLQKPGVACNADVDKTKIRYLPSSNKGVQQFVEIAAITGWVVAALLFVVVVVLAGIITAVCHKRKLKKSAAAQQNNVNQSDLPYVLNNEAAHYDEDIKKKVDNMCEEQPEQGYEKNVNVYNIYTITNKLKDEKEIPMPQTNMFLF